MYTARVLFKVALLYILFNTPGILILGINYFLLPTQLTLQVMGGILGIIGLASLALFIVIYGLGFIGLRLKSEVVPASLDSLPESAQKLVEMLEEEEFKFLGERAEDKILSKDKNRSLVYINASNHIRAAITITPENNTMFSYLTAWPEQRFIITDGDSTGFRIRKSDFRLTSLKTEATEVYNYHCEQVKEMLESWGTPLQVKTFEDIEPLERDILLKALPELGHHAVLQIMRPTIGAIIPVMAFASLFVEAGIFLKLVPEADTIPSDNLTIVFVGMGALVFLVATPLLNQTKAE